MINQSSATYSGQLESAGANPIQKGRQTALSIFKNLLALGLFAFLLLGVQGTLAAQEYPVIGNNIAQFKPAKQSSTLDWKSTAYRAVDGNTDGNWATPSVMHTKLEHGAWWEVDLLDQYDISEIIIYNRTDEHSNRLSGFTISVSDEPMEGGANNGDLFASEPGNPGKSKTYSGSKRGRYVKIQLNRRSDGKRQYLHMAEVQVKGKLVKTLPRINDNVALGKPARQSSIYKVFLGEANLANDGNTAGRFWVGSVTHTNADLGAWWEVDLGEVYEVSKVTIYNRTDEQSQRLSDFVIKYSDKPMRNVADGDVFKQIKDYPRIYGDYRPDGGKGTVNARFIRVALNERRGILSLAEVQVAGKLPGKVLSNNNSDEYYWTYVKRENTGATEFRTTLTNSVEKAADYQLEESFGKNTQVSAEYAASMGVSIKGVLDISASWKVGTALDWSKSTTNTSNQSQTVRDEVSDDIPIPASSTVYFFTKWKETKGRVVVAYDGINWPYTATTAIEQAGAGALFAYGINDEVAPELRQYKAGYPIPDEIFQKIRVHNIAYENKKNATGGAVTGTTGSNPGATSAQSGGPSTDNTSTVDVATVKEVLFHSQASLSLAEAQAIAQENGWKIASSSEVEAAFTYRNLDVYAFGRMADGRFAVPVQSNHSNFQKGPNIDAVGGNQGFFYTGPGATVATSQETSQNDNDSAETSVTVVECSDGNGNLVGYFKFKKGTGKWVETDAVGKTKFTYELTGKEDQAIHLRDVSRSVDICLELDLEEVLYSDSNNTTPFSIYTISDAY